MATRNQGVCGSFNNGIAVVTGIIGGITGFNLNGFQAGATREGTTTDACHAVGDGDGGQAAATFESKIADAGHAVGDGDGGQVAAISESSITNRFYTIGCFTVCDRCRYGDTTSIFAGTVISHRCCASRSIEVVINAVNVGIIGM